MYKNRLNSLKQWLQTQAGDVAYISDPSHIAYYTGYQSEPHERVLALFVFKHAEPFLFTPALEVDDAKDSPWPYDVYGYLDSEDPWNIIQQAITVREKECRQFAIEKNHLPYANYEALTHYFPSSQFSLDLSTFIEQQLLIKSSDEIDIMLEAGHWADVAFEIGFQAIKAGAKETDLVAEIEYQLKKQGVAQMSFDTLVLAGENAASPHGVPSANTVKPHELVLFDLGVIWKGYCSDATRTVAYQEPTDFQVKIYDIVLAAQTAALQAVKPGIKASELDAIARNVITDAGYGPYFNHRLGHGIGTTVHEYPSLVAGNDLVIEEGMCFSLEPGIYLPEQVGVRIEDCGYVTADGFVPFTQTPKNLQVIS